MALDTTARGLAISGLAQAKQYTDTFNSQVTNIEATLDGTGLIFTVIGGATFTISISDWNALTDSEKLKIAIIDSTGDGSKYLSDNGTYKVVGDMSKSIYDPTNVLGDAFDMDNMNDGSTYVRTHNDYTTTEKNKLAGIANNANNYILPTASTTVSGGVKVDGSTIVINDGVISSIGGGGGGGYQPDNITITLTEDSKLEVSESLINDINGVGTEILVSDAASITQILQPNTFYIIDADTNCTSLTLSLADKIDGVYSIYSASIKCGATPPSFTAIDGVTWNDTFSLQANKTTEISIVNGNGIFFAY